MQFDKTIEVTNFTSESIIPDKDFMEYIFKDYPIVIANTDYDRAGKHAAFQMRALHKIPIYMNTDITIGKDITDICANKGFKFCIELVKDAYNDFISNFENENTCYFRSGLFY